MAYRFSRLPRSFPVGTKLVIEGPRGGEGQAQVYSRYLEFPDGTCMALPSRAVPQSPPSRRRRPRSRRW
jgi:hypothetical protein